jgi:flavin reductase (DIM6/NTAB) family NADH-FMN oxidoreductase RutF
MAANETGVDDASFKTALAAFPTGVAVVTAFGAGGPVGLTVNAFAAVSLIPRLLLVCVDKGSNTLPAIRSSGAFTVNVLDESGERVAQRFASKLGDKFAGLAWDAPARVATGPVLRDFAVAYFGCRVEHSVEAGDHWIFVGEAVEVGCADAAKPLLYHRSAFSSMT